MITITYPYSNQLNQFSFCVSKTTRISFCMDERTSSIRSFPICGSEEPVVSRFYFSINDVPYSIQFPICVDDVTLDTIIDAWHMLLVYFAKIGYGYETIGDFDNVPILQLDPLSLNSITDGYADWITIENQKASINSMIVSEASNDIIAILSNSARADGKIDVNGSNGRMELSGIHSFRYLLLGELDPRTFEELDEMLSVFEKTMHLPAVLNTELIMRQSLDMAYGVPSIESAKEILVKQNTGIAYSEPCTELVKDIEFKQQSIAVEYDTPSVELLLDAQASHISYQLDQPDSAHADLNTEVLIEHNVCTEHCVPVTESIKEVLIGQKIDLRYNTPVLEQVVEVCAGLIAHQLKQTDVASVSLATTIQENLNITHQLQNSTICLNLQMDENTE